MQSRVYHTYAHAGQQVLASLLRAPKVGAHRVELVLGGVQGLRGPVGDGARLHAGTLEQTVAVAIATHTTGPRSARAASLRGCERVHQPLLQPYLCGMMRWLDTEPAPALSPKIITLLGSPPVTTSVGHDAVRHAHRPATRHPFARTERSDVLLHPLHGQALVLEAGITRGMSRILDMSTAGKSVSEWGKTLGQS